MQFRPCIDLHKGRVKQIVGSSLSDSSDEVEVNFESTHSSSYYADMYRLDQLTGGHIIQLGPDNADAAIRALQAWPGGMQLGGGVNLDNAEFWLDSGASHVIVTSYVFRDGVIDMDRLNALVDKIGRERLVLDLSCKERDSEYWIVTDRWQKFTEMKISKDMLSQLSQYCSEFLVHAASVEGKMEGPDLRLVSILASSPIPVTYAGGVTTLEQLKDVKRVGLDRVHVTIGSALDIFGGSLSYREVVELCRS